MPLHETEPLSFARLARALRCGVDVDAKHQTDEIKDGHPQQLRYVAENHQLYQREVL